MVGALGVEGAGLGGASLHWGSGSCGICSQSHNWEWGLNPGSIIPQAVFLNISCTVCQDKNHHNNRQMAVMNKRTERRDLHWLGENKWNDSHLVLPWSLGSVLAECMKTLWGRRNSLGTGLLQEFFLMSRTAGPRIREMSYSACYHSVFPVLRIFTCLFLRKLTTHI